MAVVENAHSINVVASDVDQSTKSSYTTNNNNRNPVSTMSYRSNDYHHHHHQQQQQLQKVTPLQPPSNTNGNGYVGDDDGGDGFKKEMSDLEEMLSKLNPMAEEFVPHQRLQLLPSSPAQFGYAAVNNFLVHTNTAAFANGTPTTTRRVQRFRFPLFVILIP